MSKFWLDYFQIWDKSLKSILRIWWALFRSYITTKRFCSPLQCLFCKLVQMSNCDRLNSANEHILDKLFPNLRQIPKIHLAYMVGTIEKFHSLKNICSPIQCFFCKLVQMSNFGRLKSANGPFWIDYFQIWGKSLKSIWRIWWALFRSSSTSKGFAHQCSAFSVNWCKFPILIG